MSDIIAKRYKLVSSLGQGGMADVYLANDTILDRKVAVKILRGDMETNPVALLRFEREANASASLSHPNIVEVYDVGEDEGRHYIVMEYIEGDNLKQLINRRGALSKEEAVDIMKQLASATQCAHESGIIHRDIKSQNVLMKADGTCKIADFGIAMAQDAVQLTQTDSVMGSVHYMAPELGRGEVATAQSDIYALGIVLYELLRGDLPFQGDTPVQIVLKQMRDEMPSIREYNSTIPQSLENVILKATAKNKNYRYKSAQEMLEDISTALNPRRAHEKKVVFQSDDEDGKTIMIDQVVRVDDEKEEVEEATENDSKMKIVLAIAIVVVAALALAVTLFLNSLSDAQAERYVQIPDLKSHTVTEAKSILAELGLDVNTSAITYELTDNVPAGQILSSYPEMDATVEKGSKVSLVVSSGIYLVVDDYVGMGIEEAKKKLSEFSKIRVIHKEISDDTAEPGVVLTQAGLNPGDKIDPDKTYEIVLTTAKYTTIVIPMSIEGMDVVEAIQYFEKQGVQVVQNPLSTEGLSEEELWSLARGVVIKTTPSKGSSYTQTADSYVTISYYPAE